MLKYGQGGGRASLLLLIGFGYSYAPDRRFGAGARSAVSDQPPSLGLIGAQHSSSGGGGRPPRRLVWFVGGLLGVRDLILGLLVALSARAHWRPSIHTPHMPGPTNPPPPPPPHQHPQQTRGPAAPRPPHPLDLRLRLGGRPRARLHGARGGGEPGPPSLARAAGRGRGPVRGLPSSLGGEPAGGGGAAPRGPQARQPPRGCRGPHCLGRLERRHGAERARPRRRLWGQRAS